MGKKVVTEVAMSDGDTDTLMSQKPQPSRATLAEKRQSLVDPDYAGEDYCIDAEIEKGPLANRRCTDVFCLLVFLACLAVSGYIGVYIVGHGNPALIMAPYDADGNFCGQTEGFEDYPYLWYWDVTAPNVLIYSVCVSACPSESSLVVHCHTTSNVQNCNPNYAYNSTLFLERWCTPVYTDLPSQYTDQYNNVIGSYGLDDVEIWLRDVRESWPVYCICVPMVLILVFIWNLLLRTFAEILAWVCIWVVGLSFLGLGFFVWFYADATYPEGDSTQKWLQIASYAIWTLTVIYFLIVCCTYYAIKISARVLKVSARIVMNNLRVVIVPVFGMIVILVWLVFFAYVLLYMMSCGEMQQNSLGGLTYYSYVWTQQEKWYMAWAAFMFLWVTAFILASTKYVIIVACASWYFTSNKNHSGDFGIFRGYKWLWRYNVGSVLFGAFVITVMWIIRIIFEYIDRKIKQSGGGNAPGVATLMKVCRCCLDCCHRFVKYINENAYCQVVLTGENFCMAAVNGFLLILKHATTFAFTKGVGGIFNLLGKLTVCGGCTVACYFILRFWPELYNKLDEPIAPLVVVFLISYCLATVFMSIYATTSLCILHCLYADIDICQQLSRDETENANRPQEMTPIVGMLSSSGLKPLMS